MKSRNESITWTEFRTGLPVVIALGSLLVSVALAYATLSSRIDSNRQTLVTQQEAIKDMKQDVKEIKNSTEQMAKDIVQIKTVLGIGNVRASIPGFGSNDLANSDQAAGISPQYSTIYNSSPNSSQQPNPTPILPPTPTPILILPTLPIINTLL